MRIATMNKRDVTGLAVVQDGYYLYNHASADTYPRKVPKAIPGVAYWGARVLASTKAGDVVQLHPDIKTTGLGTVWIQEHYQRIGLQVASKFVYNESLDVMDEYPDAHLSVLLQGKLVSQVRPNSTNSILVEKMNDRNQFIRMCQDCDIPVPDTYCVDSVRSALCLRPSRYPVYVKGAVPAPIKHVIRCDSEEEYCTAVEKIAGPLQVQEALPKNTIYYNVQYQTTSTEQGLRLSRRGLVERRAESLVHPGNFFPTKVNQDRIWLYSDSLANHLFNQGMVGVWAFDVAVVGEKVYFMECKLRWNSATYCSIPAQRLGITEWESVSALTLHTDFSFMQKNFGQVEYNKTTKRGIVVISWATILSNRLSLLVAGNSVERQKFLTMFRDCCT